MVKRQLIIDGYRTAEDGLWTMSACKITKAPQVQGFTDVPGRFAPLDLSTTPTNGEPYYTSATLDVVLESSEGTRQERQARIDEMVNRLDGYTVKVVHPDHPNHYLVARVQVTPDYNDWAHCSVLVSGVCEPWLYACTEKVVTCNATTAEQTVDLTNSGRLSLSPRVTVTGEVTLTYGSNVQVLTAGHYTLPWLHLTPGPHSLSCTGSGTVTFTYREAVLAI